MAVLDNTDRAKLWADFMSSNTEVMGITKADLRAAVDAIDDWLNTNASTLNSVIPQPARGTLSTKQKAKLLVHVIEKRYERT